MTYISGYTPDVNLINDIELKKEERKDITFSLSYNSEVGDEVSQQIQKTMIDTVKNNFRESQLFNRIHYLPYNKNNKYHYHFDIKLSGPNIIQQEAAGLMAGMTLCLIPTKISYYVDITMFVFENGKEKYSITAPEEVSDVFWLPLIITSPFMNHYTSVSRVVNKSTNYFIQKIIENKLY